MHTSDLMTHTMAYVFGQCMLWNQHAKQFNGDWNDQAFLSFAHRTHNVCWRYLNGQQTLDGTCSDFECDVAIKCRAVFKSHINSDI
jgi:hypothetical protein